MIYKSVSISAIFLFFNSCILNALECQLSWNETPSLKVGINVTDTCSAGIKVNLKNINIPAFYYVYKQYQNFTHEEKISLLKNPNLFINAQTALYIINKNKHLKFKAQLIKASNESPILYLGSSQYFNEQFSTKEKLLLNSTTVELHTAARYNKKRSDTMGVQVQTFIKNDETPYFTIDCFCPIYKTIGIRENILFRGNNITPTWPKVYNSTKNNPISLALNTGLNCLAIAGNFELEFQFQDEEQIAAYRQQIIKTFDEKITPVIDSKLNELKKDLS